MSVDSSTAPLPDWPDSRDADKVKAKGRIFVAEAEVKDLAQKLSTNVSA